MTETDDSNIGLPLIVFVDPPFGPLDVEWSAFRFSDIVVPYARIVARVLRGKARVVLVGSYGTAPTCDGVEVIGIPGINENLRNLVTQMFFLRSYARVISRLNPAIVHCPDYLCLAVISRYIGKKSVLALTTPGSILERMMTHNPYEKSYTWMLRWATWVLARSNSVVLATSPYMMKWWAMSAFDPSRTVLVPLPTEVSLGEDVQALSVDGSTETNSNPVISLIVVAGLRPENRVDLAIELFSRTVQIIPSGRRVRLSIVGSGPLMEDLRRQAGVQGVQHLVDFLGHQLPPDLPRMMGAADVMLVSRRYNATPRVAQQGLCYGLPIVSNLNESLHGFHDTIDHYIHDIDFSTESAARELADILSNLPGRNDRSKLAEVSRSVFSSDVVGMQVSDLFMSWLTGRT